MIIISWGDAILPLVAVVEHCSQETTQMVSPSSPAVHPCSMFLFICFHHSSRNPFPLFNTHFLIPSWFFLFLASLSFPFSYPPSIFISFSLIPSMPHSLLTPSILLFVSQIPLFHDGFFLPPHSLIAQPFPWTISPPVFCDFPSPKVLPYLFLPPTFPSLAPFNPPFVLFTFTPFYPSILLHCLVIEWVYY